jgi:hypothetical protein
MPGRLARGRGVLDNCGVTNALRSGYLQPALLGGLVTGVLSALPIVSAGNVCCCLWVVSGGLLSAYLLQQNQSSPITAGDGALVGLLAGVSGAFVQFALSIPIGLLVGPIERQMLDRLRAVSGNAGAGTPFDLDGGGMLGVLLLSIIGFFVMLVVGTTVSTLAGVVGAALFSKATPATPQDGASDWGGGNS